MYAIRSYYAKSELLFAAMRDFDLTYSAYADFQRQMERYWCLRWLRQENVQTIDATIRRENLVKLDHLPLLQRVPSVPDLAPGQRVRLSVDTIDFLTLELGCRYLETLEAVLVQDGELDEEASEEGAKSYNFV